MDNIVRIVDSEHCRGLTGDYFVVKITRFQGIRLNRQC